MEFKPKQFYRKIDRLLQEIDQAAPDKDYFVCLVSDMIDWFGDELHIENGRVYSETSGGFELEREVGSLDPTIEGLVLRRDYKPLELVLEHGAYLFDESVEGQAPQLEKRLGGLNSAAILIEGDRRRILAFGLRKGWDRVRLDFALKTMRNAINHRLQVEHLRTGLAQAAEIQRSLLPDGVPEFPGFSLAARSIPAETVGGDFYDFLPQGDEMMYIAIGDVSGHGLPSALLARDVITGLRMGAELEFRTAAMVRRLNRVIAQGIMSTRFVSLFLGNFEANGNVFYVNAGHPPPWIFGKRGTRRLRLGGLILGPVPEAKFKRGFEHVDRGDSVVLVTDGVLERMNEAEEEFGETRLEELIAPLAGLPAEEILDALFAAAEAHGDGRPWVDDTTVVVVTRHTEPPA